MSTTTDLSAFGFRELKLASELLCAYCSAPPDYLSGGVQIMLNQNSGYVFLTDDECNVAMMNGDMLDAWLFTPHDGHEGFLDELTVEYKPGDLNQDDVDYILHWAAVLNFDLPENWMVGKTIN